MASKSAILVAATAPSDTAVTTCLRRFALTSPTAYKPFVLVWQSLSVITYPDLSISAKSLIRALFGTSPIATNTPSTVSVFEFSYKLSTLSLPCISSGMELRTNSILFVFLTLSTFMRAPLNSSLL